MPTERTQADATIGPRTSGQGIRTSPWAKWTNAAAVVTGLSVIGFLLRAEGLLRRSFCLDEVLTIGRTRQPTVGSLLIGLESSPFPPLYYLLLWGWGRIWGVSELSVRALPLVFGVVTLPVTYLVWSRLIGNRSAALGAGSSLHQRVSRLLQQGRQDVRGRLVSGDPE